LERPQHQVHFDGLFEQLFGRLGGFCDFGHLFFVIKFIFVCPQAYRDYHATQDQALLQHLYSACLEAMELPIGQDRDADGLIDNDGFVDYAYTAWIASGPSTFVECYSIFTQYWLT
jgi:hypothetical protein